MKLALCNVNGEFSYNLTRVELFKKVVSETAHLKDDDVLLVYTMNKGGRGIDKNVMTIHLYNGELGIYDENGVVLNTLLFDDMDYKYYRVLLSGTLAEFEYKERYNDKESRAFEQEQFEHAEAEKEYAEYTVSVYGKSLSFSGETAYNSVLDLILAVVSTVDDETGVITVEKDGRGLDIGCAKGKYNIFLRVSDDHCKWEIFEKGDRIAISKFLREWVIL